MSKLEPETESPSFQQDPGSDDEIEILEIVGLDEDAPPLGATDAPVVEESESDEMVLTFEEDGDGSPAAPVAAPAAPEENGDAHNGPISHREQFVRLQADFDNFRKRVERDQRTHVAGATSRVVKRLLPVLDNFERAVAVDSETHDAQALRDGVVLIFKQLLAEMHQEGLEAIDSLGQPFDPRVHEAVVTEYRSDLPANTVVEELQRGYLLHGRLLRPSLVKVCLGQAEDS